MVRAVLLLLLLATPAAADPTVKREGEYGGVVPGQTPDATATERGRPNRPQPKGTLAWIGFEAKDGGAQLFFQSAAAFQVEQWLEGPTLVVHLDLPRMGPNAWRQLDTRYFDNPLASVVARAVRASRGTKTQRAHGRGIAVRVRFKNAADAREATVRTATEADGQYYSYLAFPEGADLRAIPSPSTTEPE